MKHLISFLLVISTGTATAQNSADLFLFSVKGKGDTIRFEYEKNMTKREGYDNQPCFSPDGRYVYYSAKYKITHDIYRYDLNTDRIINVSKSPYTSEFSPMVMDDGQYISTVFIEEDSVTQRLWKINIASAKCKLINKKIDSVGYYWPLGNNEYAAFVLGTTEHNHSLRIIDVTKNTEEIITDSVKGCIREIPSCALLSFVQEDKSGQSKLMVFDRKNHALHTVFFMPENAVDYVWWNDYLFVPAKSDLFVYKFDRVHFTVGSTVIERDLSESPLKNGRRPAFSPDHTKLIIVGDDSTE